MLKWRNHEFESSSSTTEEFKSFSRDIKKYLKEKMVGYNLVNYNRGHFYFSAFFEKDEKFIYISSSDVRHFKDEWLNNLLVRTAENEKDYTGGRNDF